MAVERKRLIDVRHPFFLPLWRRVLVTVLLVGWTLFEIGWGGPFWALLFGGLTVYVIREFFVVFDPANFAGKDV